MLVIKPGVRIHGMCPEIWAGIWIVERVVDKLFGRAIRLTAGIDGKHSNASLHNIGHAADIGAKEFKPEEKQEILNQSLLALGMDFDFILEAAGTDNEHFHLEFQPKVGYTP